MSCMFTKAVNIQYADFVLKKIVFFIITVAHA